MSMKIGFSRDKGFSIAGTVIRAVEKTPYNHVYIRVPDYETGLDMVYQAIGSGMVTMTYERFCSNNTPVKEYILSTSPTQAMNILIFLKKNLGVSYGYMQIIAIAIEKIFHKITNLPGTDKTLICSELGAYIAKLDGMTIPEELKFETPSDLDKLLIHNNIQRTM